MHAGFRRWISNFGVLLPSNIFVYVAALKHYYLLKAWFAAFCAIVEHEQFFGFVKSSILLLHHREKLRNFFWGREELQRERERKYKSVASYGLDGDALLFLSVAVQLLYNIFGQWPA